MKFVIVALLFALVSCSQNSCVNVTIMADAQPSANKQIEPITKPDVFDKNYLSVVRLIMKTKADKNNGIVATGFAISKDHVLTAGHFCEDFHPLRAKKEIEDTIGAIRFNGDRFIESDGFVVEIYKYNKKQDMCILYKKNHQIKLVSFVKDYKSVKVGNRVTMIGAPIAIFPSKVEGYVILPNNNLYKFGKGTLNRLMISTEVHPGNSGSPIWDSQNRVIGMLVSAAPSIGVCIRADTLIKFIRAAEINHQLR